VPITRIRVISAMAQMLPRQIDPILFANLYDALGSDTAPDY
jgi:hypothetical protein